MTSEVFASGFVCPFYRIQIRTQTTSHLSTYLHINLLSSTLDCYSFVPLESFQTHKSKKNHRGVKYGKEAHVPPCPSYGDPTPRILSPSNLLIKYRTKSLLTILLQTLTGKTKTTREFPVPRYKTPSHMTRGVS